MKSHKVPMKSPSNQTLFRTAIPCRALHHDTPQSRPPPRRRKRCGRCVDSGPRCRGSANTPCLGSHGFLTEKSRKITLWLFYGVLWRLFFFLRNLQISTGSLFLTRKICSKGCLQIFVKCWEWWSWSSHGGVVVVGIQRFMGILIEGLGIFLGGTPKGVNLLPMGNPFQGNSPGCHRLTL